MEQNGNPVRPEASADEHASFFNPAPPAAPAAASPTDDASVWPTFASRAEADAFWRGVSHGLRSSGRDVSHPHMPPDFPLQLARDGSAPGLTSNKLIDAWPHQPGDEASHGTTGHGPAAPAPRADRHDGLTVAAEQHFLRVLAETGVVADACRAVGISRPAVYNRRNSAAGRAFALAWEAALLLSRRAVADDVMSRVRHGVIERVYRNGELVAERHKYDNRLTMAALTRLDRIAEGHGANAPAVNAIADEFDQFVGNLPHGLEEAEDFIAARCPDPTTQAAAPADAFAKAGEEALLGRLATYEAYGAGLADEIDTGDLDAAAMESWTDEQFDRAEAADYFRWLAAEDWPAAALEPAADGTDGMCKVRKLYLLFHPARRAAPAPEPVDDFAGCDVWEDRNLGWMTDFPPPPGFDGFEEGDPDSEYYHRELAPCERAVIEADIAAQRAGEPDPSAEREAARLRYFDLGEPERSEMSEGDAQGTG
jgi:hypothetical protein